MKRLLEALNRWMSPPGIVVMVFVGLLLLVLGAVMSKAVFDVEGLRPSVPAETVRALSVGDEKLCSAVVVAPDYALTARHCLRLGFKIDSVEVEYVIAAAPENRDIAMAYVPGLKCPCAALGARPAIGEEVVAVGFPGGGERRVTAPAKVQFVDTPTVLAPWTAEYVGFGDAVFIITDKVLLSDGDSGGGLFSFQGGEWKLIGINAVSIPASPVGMEEQASGFVPVDLASKFLPQL